MRNKVWNAKASLDAGIVSIAASATADQPQQQWNITEKMQKKKKPKKKTNKTQRNKLPKRTIDSKRQIKENRNRDDGAANNWTHQIDLNETEWNESRFSYTLDAWIHLFGFFTWIFHGPDVRTTSSYRTQYSFDKSFLRNFAHMNFTGMDFAAISSLASKLVIAYNY